MIMKYKAVVGLMEDGHFEIWITDGDGRLQTEPVALSNDVTFGLGIVDTAADRFLASRGVDRRAAWVPQSDGTRTAEVTAYRLHGFVA